MTAPFIPGLELARQFHAEVVGPALGRSFPGVRYAAALIGWGSDVLGFDSTRSTDHNWGPRLQLYLAPGDARLAGQITELLAGLLPATFRGWPTAFPDATSASDAPRHWVEVAELGSWLDGQLGFDPRRGVTLLDWLGTPTQRLAEVTAGSVFHDGLDAAREPGPGGTGAPGPPGGLGAARSRLAWYPRDIWLYVLACQWGRISQEEAFPGRCAEVGDEVGSAVVTGRLARDLMRLGLLMQRRYPPYSKWLGTAFARMPGSGPLLPVLAGAVSAVSWPERERNLCAAYEATARMHNELRITDPVGIATRQYFDRPFQVLAAGRMAAALRTAIADPAIRRLPPTGAVDQFVDSTDATGDIGLLRAVTAAALRRGTVTSGG
jgi:hypothetical protein